MYYHDHVKLILNKTNNNGEAGLCRRTFRKFGNLQTTEN